MRLVSVYDVPDAEDILYVLLEQRTPEQSISHRKMPTLPEHRAFIKSKPYLAWYLNRRRCAIRRGHLPQPTT
jgi:hypothetical protein